MRYIKKIPGLMLAVLMASPSACSARLYDPWAQWDDGLWDMGDMFEEMQVAQQRMRTQMRSMRSTPMPGIRLSAREDDDKMILTAHAVGESNVTASLNRDQNVLTISTSNGTITLATQRYPSRMGWGGPSGSLLSYQIVHERREERSQKEDGNQRGQQFSSYASRSASSQTMNIDGELLLKRAAVTYDKTQDALTITIPMMKIEEKTTPIPVQIVEATPGKDG